MIQGGMLGGPVSPLMAGRQTALRNCCPHQPAQDKSKIAVVLICVDIMIHKVISD